MAHAHHTSLARWIIAALFGLAAASQAISAPVTVTYFSSYADAFRGSDSSYDFEENLSTAYGTRSLNASTGDNETTSLVDWQDTGGGALLNFSMDQRHSDSAGSSAFAGVYMTLTVGPSDTAYSLAGLYAATKQDGATYLDVYIWDMYAGQHVFQDYSYSEFTADESFVLGVANDGDTSINNVGSLTGTLLAGRSYTFWVGAYISAYPSDGGGTATGCVSLALGTDVADATCGAGTQADVPEPGSLALAGLALAGLALSRRRR